MNRAARTTAPTNRLHPIASPSRPLFDLEGVASSHDRVGSANLPHYPGRSHFGALFAARNSAACQMAISRVGPLPP